MLLCMPSLHDTTKGSDLFSAIEACINRYNLPWEKLCGLTTDGAPEMTGKNNGLVGLLEEKLKDCSNHKLISIHCIIHQEALCAKVCNMEHVIVCDSKISNLRSVSWAEPPTVPIILESI